MRCSPAEVERLVEQHTPLVWSIVRRFLGRGVEAEDLFQLGSIGLLKAIDGFDEAFGTRFSTYAVHKSMGEIQRFLRDDGPVKVSRSLREKSSLIRQARDRLLQETGQEPGVQALARATGLEPEEIALCENAGRAVLSLDAPLSPDGAEDGGSLLDLQADPGAESRLLDRMDLEKAVGQLEPLERQVVALRFFRDLTQQKTADLLGLTQVRVSRMEKRILQKLRKQMQ